MIYKKFDENKYSQVHVSKLILFSHDSMLPYGMFVSEYLDVSSKSHANSWGTSIIIK